MAKNEIHARLHPRQMEALKNICVIKSCNLSDIVRAALALYVDIYECPNLFERHKLSMRKDGLEVGLIGVDLETTRATPELLDELDLQKKNNSVVQLVEQELGIFFARCRDEYDPQDGQLYWFWFESKNECFDADSHNNWCPTKRFNSQEDAIKACLQERLLNLAHSIHLTKPAEPSPKKIAQLEFEEIIDW